MSFAEQFAKQHVDGTASTASGTSGVVIGYHDTLGGSGQGQLLLMKLSGPPSNLLDIALSAALKLGFQLVTATVYPPNTVCYRVAPGKIANVVANSSPPAATAAAAPAGWTSAAGGALPGPSPSDGPTPQPVMAKAPAIKKVDPWKPKPPKFIPEWPHKCPRCKGPAIEGAFNITCKGGCTTRGKFTEPLSTRQEVEDV